MICENRHSCFQERTCFNDLSEWALQHHDEQNWGIFALSVWYESKGKGCLGGQSLFSIKVIRVWGGPSGDMGAYANKEKWADIPIQTWFI